MTSDAGLLELIELVEQLADVLAGCKAASLKSLRAPMAEIRKAAGKLLREVEGEGK